MSRRGIFLALLLAGAAACAPGALRAQGIDMTKGGPVEVTSDNGMEWHQDDQTIIAKGNAKAVRGNVTVTADELIAHYRKKATAPGTPGQAGTPGQPAAKPATPNPAATGVADTGDNEIYRLEAVGNVHIFTATDQAFADHAVYDMDQAVLILTGHNLHILTPNQTMTARDVMEYWSQKHMAVGRGDAVVTTNDGRQLTADIIVGYTEDSNAPPAPGVQQVAAQTPAPAPGKPPKPGSDPVLSSGKLKRVDAFGHVVVRTATEIAQSDKGVYVPDTGIARLAGNVHITRGQNQLNGDFGTVNLHTGISTVTRDPGHRVEGLVVPNDTTKDAAPAKSPATPPAAGAAGKEGTH